MVQSIKNTQYIDSWFHFYNNKEVFLSNLNKGFINPDSICFIKDTGQIYTNDSYIGIDKTSFNSLCEEVEKNTSALNTLLGTNKEDNGKIDSLKEVIYFLEEFTESDRLKDIIINISDDLSSLYNSLNSIKISLENQIQQLNPKIEELEGFKKTKGVPNGVASLNENGQVPSSQLPSYVDDVLEFSTFSEFPDTGETGKIYTALDTNIIYRWSGSQYTEISKSLALGETSSTAYPGNKGKETTDNLLSHIEDVDNPHKVTKSQVGLSNVDNTSDINKPISINAQKALDDKLDKVEINKYLTINDATETYQPKGNYLTQHQDISHLATKEEVNNAIIEIDVTNQLKDYAKKSEIPSIEGLISKTEADETYQPKGNYLTHHQDISYLISAEDAAKIFQPKGNYLTSHQSLYPLTIKKNGTQVGTYDPSSTSTIDIADVASSSTLSSHINNNNIHITSSERSLWNTTATNLSTILGSNSDTVINKWDEIVNFLSTYTEADTLANLLSNKADKSQLSNYLLTTNASSLYQPIGNYVLTSSYTADNILEKLLTVDGASSGLDADLLDGYHGSDYLRCYWTYNPGYDCDTIPKNSFVTFTYSNNAPFAGTVAHFGVNDYGFYLGTRYNTDGSLYYRRHGRQADGGIGAWQQLARITDNVASSSKLTSSYGEVFINPSGLLFQSYMHPDAQKIWNETNDGHNSGLDADTLDGYHAQDLINIINSLLDRIVVLEGGIVESVTPTAISWNNRSASTVLTIISSQTPTITKYMTRGDVTIGTITSKGNNKYEIKITPRIWVSSSEIPTAPDEPDPPPGYYITGSLTIKTKDKIVTVSVSGETVDDVPDPEPEPGPDPDVPDVPDP